MISLDQYFKEQIDKDDSDLVMFDENGFVEAFIDKEDVIYVFKEFEDDNDMDYYSGSEDVDIPQDEEELASLMDDDTYDISGDDEEGEDYGI